MKTFNFFAVLLIATVLFASCNDEEEGISRQVTKIYNYSQNIRGAEGVKGELTLPGLNLTDVIGNDPAENLQNAEMQLASSYLEISGLNQIEAPEEGPVVLENFTIKVGSRQGVNLGNCSTDPQGINEFGGDVQQSTNEIINLIRNVFSDLTSGSKSVEITVSFTPNVNISSSDNVRLNISFGGTYNYLVYE